MQKTYIIIVLFFLGISNFSCKTTTIKKQSLTKNQRLKIVKSNLNITKSEFRYIKNKDSVINELYISIKDSIKIPLVERRLDSFLLKSYTKEELLGMLKLDREYKGQKVTIEYNRNAKPENTKKVKNLGEVVKYTDKVFNDLKNSLIVQDSTVIKKDSIH